MQLSVVIADDEELARTRLRTLIGTTTDAQLVAECQDGVAALEAIRKYSPDIAFLDIAMPELDGLEVIRALRPARLPVFIITTAHARFALPAFEVHAVDFLLKPFNEERFKTAMNWACEKACRARHQSKRESGGTSTQSAPSRLAIRSNRRLVFVQPSEINWIRSAGNYCELHVGSATHLLRIRLSNLEAQLAPIGFVRISRSTLVNVSFVSEVLPKSHGDRLIVLKNGVRLVASRRWRVVLRPEESERFRRERGCI